MSDLLPTGPRKRGGQTKISVDRLQRFVAYVANGMPLESASKAIGVGSTTRKGWVRRGITELVRLQDAGIDPTDLFDPTEERWPTPEDWRTCPDGIDAEEWPFVVFAVGQEKALASFEARMLTAITTAATTSWQAAAWMLERRNPTEYARPETRLLIEHKGQVEVDVEHRVISVDELEAKFAELDATLGPERSGSDA